MNLFDLFVKISAKDEASGVIQNIATGVRSFAKVGVAAVSAVGAGMVAFGKSSVDTGMQFDGSMSQVAATLGKTTDEIGDLRDFAMEMGATTAFSAVQAADALNYMALAGYDSAKSMEMLPTVLDLAAAGNMDLARASDMVTDAESALGLQAGEAATMVDQMAKTASKSNTSVEQLGDAILTIGGTAQFMAGGTDRLNTVLGILADNGIKGSEAGIHLRNMLLKLSAPTEEGTKMIKDMGLEIFDASGNMRDMQDIMLDLNEAMADMTDEEKVGVISELFNARDIAAVNALLGTTEERWNELGEAISGADGAAKAMAETQLDNLTGDVTLFKSAMEGAKITLSNRLTPALRTFVQRGTQEIGKLDRAFQKGGINRLADQLGRSLGDGVSMIARKIPDFLKVAGTLAGSIVSTIADGIVDGAPLMLKGAAKLINKLADGMVDKAPEIGKKIGNLLAELISDAPQLIPAGLKFVYNLGIGILQGIPGIVTGIWNGLKGAFSEPVSYETQLAIESVKDFERSISEMKESLDLSNEFAEIDSKFGMVDKWIATYDELSGKTNLTKDEQIKLASAIEGLNGLLPETQQIVQDETGAWSMNTEEIRKNIQAMEDRAKADAYIDGSKKVLQELVDMEIQAKTHADLSKEYAANASGMRRSAREIGNALNEMADYYDDIKFRGEQIMVQDLPAPARALAEQWGYTGQLSADQIANITLALQKLQEETEKSAQEADSLSEAHAEMAQKAEAAMADLQKTYDAYISQAAAHLNTLEGQAYSSGVSVGSGLAAGMRAAIHDVQSAAFDLANAASVNINKKLLVHSPSKVAMRTGKFVAEGLALGLLDRTAVSDVKNASDALASFAVPDVTPTEVPEHGTSASYGSSGSRNESKVIKLYLDGDKLVGGTSERMDGSLGQMQAYQLRWEGV